ncbi:MAG TPA: helix-turn-helix transcriptional regulator [Gammaproteobacteria bacterium]
MIRDDEHWLALTEAFYSAALDEQSWYSALEGLAAATGSRSGQLIGLGADALSFNILTAIDPAMLQDPAAADAGDPGINPRVAAGIAAPALTTLTEADFAFPEEYTSAPRHREFENFMRRIDRPYICLSALERQPDRVIGLAVNRSKSEGRITHSQREIFTSLAPHARAAVRMQLALEGQGAKLLADAMDALSIPAFICDHTGCVQAFTPAAERIASEERGVQLRQGRLVAAHAEDSRTLGAAIAAASRVRMTPAPPAMQTVIVRDRHLKTPSLVLDVMTLPKSTHAFHFTPGVLVIGRGEQHGTERKAAILQAAYALTPAETAVALQIACGKTIDVIAAGRGVSAGTVRSQIKAILAKLGVHRQIELVARLNTL